MNFFDHKDVGNHLMQLCPKVVKHPVYIYIFIYIYIYIYILKLLCTSGNVEQKMKNRGLKSVSITKQNFMSLRRSTGIIYKYRAVKIPTAFKHTNKGQPKDKNICALSCDEVYRPFLSG